MSIPRYYPIATVTVGSSASKSIIFSNIPSTFKDLLILCSLRTNGTGSSYGEQVDFRFNGSALNFSSKRVEGYNQSVQTSTETDGRFGRATSDNGNQTANAFASIETYIPKYASSTNKAWISHSVTEINSDLYNEMFYYAGLWSNTSPITSIAIVGSDGGSFVQHSTATLYGIGKA